MSNIETIYPLAVEHTKQKVYDDIDRYLENKEELPTFQQYLHDRIHYYDQIWINVWLNTATNKASKGEKKKFLSEKGFEVEGVDRKLINTLFRNEMRTYKPFPVIDWLNQTFLLQEEKWKERYERAQYRYLNREKEQQLFEQRRELQDEIEDEIAAIIQENAEQLFLKMRYFVAEQLKRDFANKVKYPKVDTFALEIRLVAEGPFNPDNYTTFGSFLEELTGDIHKTSHQGRTFFEYETYYYVYERVIEEHLFHQAFQLIQCELPLELVKTYEDLFAENIHDLDKEMLSEPLYEFMDDLLPKLEEEYIAGLLKLADIPFEIEKHKEIYEKDRSFWIKRKMEELAEIERKKQEEARVLEDIFGREYSPSSGRGIRYVLHIGETNTGKTYHALERMKEAASGLYLAPLRLLALEVYDKLNTEGTPCSLKTGEEEKIVANSQHISCTVEMFHEKDFYEVIVIDEAQMITDKDRGFSWYKAITKANADEVHIIGSKNAKSMILKLLGDSDIEVIEYQRDIPLEVES